MAALVRVVHDVGPTDSILPPDDLVLMTSMLTVDRRADTIDNVGNINNKTEHQCICLFVCVSVCE